MSGSPRSTSALLAEHVGLPRHAEPTHSDSTHSTGAYETTGIDPIEWVRRSRDAAKPRSRDRGTRDAYGVGVDDAVKSDPRSAGAGSVEFAMTVPLIAIVGVPMPVAPGCNGVLAVIVVT